MDHNILDDEFNQQEENPQADGIEPRYAGFSIRLAAALIDGLLIMLPLNLLLYWNFVDLKILPLAIVLTLCTIIYKPLYEYGYGATIGKRLVSLKVVSTRFQPLTLNQAILRAAPWIIVGMFSLYTTILLFFEESFLETDTLEELALLMEQHSGMGDQLASWFVIISCMAVLFNVKKQALHDQLADTYVLEEPRSQPQ